MGRQAGGLQDYAAKRDFRRTPEPKAARRRSGKQLRYLIQKHAARRLHYDFRLEFDGVLMSWAIPKGPSEDPGDKRLAVHVEDHPIDYGSFEGTIPKGEYGGGTVMQWDTGSWVPQQDDVKTALRKGKLSFELQGQRLKGLWALVRLRSDGSGKDNWLLIKEHDALVRSGGKPMVERETTSITTGRDMDAIAAGIGGKRVHSSAGKPAAKTKSAARPAFVAPQLATLVDAPPDGPDWLHEIKFDGYRAIAAIADGSVTMWTRKGLDWTDRFRSLAGPLAKLDCRVAEIDGEIAVADKQGRTDFGALQEALSGGGGQLIYQAFDLLHLDGEDLRNRPLRERKRLLKDLLADSRGPVVFSDHAGGGGRKLFAEACRRGLEGIISKRADAPYKSGRGLSWLKCKCGHEQEFVVIGWCPSTRRGRPFSSLLLAVRDDGELRYAGRVGSGFTGHRLDELAAKFKSLARTSAPAEGVPAAIARQAKYLTPKLVAEIAFRGWTRDGQVRQGSFKGLRGDKPADDIVKEKPMRKEAAVKPARQPLSSGSRAHDDGAETIAGVRVTHPDRVLFEGSGVTKRDLIQHYLTVADAMLAHLGNRPISLVRCPRGSGETCFFQKHAPSGMSGMFETVRIREKSGSDEYLYISDERSLVSAVQMNVLEFHIWGCHVDDIEHPDRLVFDFDPDEGLPFARVRDAAREMRDRLSQFKLESFPMLTGGKGVHVVVPLKRGHPWDRHREFAEALARMMAGDDPERYLATMSKAKRAGRIFIDYLRNQRGATAIAPWSTRARPGATVAVPVSWTQLARADSAAPLAVGGAARWLRRDPWEGYAKLKQVLPAVT